MASSAFFRKKIFIFVFYLVASSQTPVQSVALLSDSGHRTPVNQTFRPGNETQKLRRTTAYLKKVNKPAVKTIQAFSFVFGDFIMCED